MAAASSPRCWGATASRNSCSGAGGWPVAQAAHRNIAIPNRILFRIAALRYRKAMPVSFLQATMHAALFCVLAAEARSQTFEDLARRAEALVDSKPSEAADLYRQA